MSIEMNGVEEIKKGGGAKGIICTWDITSILHHGIWNSAHSERDSFKEKAAFLAKRSNIWQPQWERTTNLF